MKHALTALVLVALITSVRANDRPLGGFEFQGLALNAFFTAVAPQWLKSCTQSRDTRRDFCLSKSQVGDVGVTVEVGYLDGYVDSISVYFPRSDFETIREALRLRYGHEAVSTERTARWWSHPPGGTKFPDSIQLRLIPEPEPKPDGEYWLKGAKYSEIAFLSAWVVNNLTDKLPPQQRRRVEGAARGL